MTSRMALFPATGAFTPRAGTGTLSLGAISTITNDTYYNAWPVVVQTADDALAVGYTKGFTHHADNVGNMKIKRSVDGASTWTSEIQGYYDLATPRWVSIVGLTTLSTGRMIATLFRDNYAVAGTGEAGVVYSDDHGLTWTDWIDVPNSFTEQAFAAGAVVELGNGDLLIPIEGSNTGISVANRSCFTLRSSDGGLTWGSEVSVRDYSDDTRPYYETCLLLLDNGELIAIHRTSELAGTHYIQRSTDQGATTGGWGAPSAIFSGYGKPNTIQASSGTLIAVTRRNSDAACVAFTSTNRGVTWGSAFVIESGMFEMEYGCPVELSLGSYLIVYGTQPTSSISNSDIKQAFVTETIA